MLCYRPVTTLLVLAATAGAGAAAEGEDLSLERIILDAQQVTTASRYAEDLRLAPNVMYSYSEHQIRRLGLETLGDLLDITPGFKVFYKDLQRVAQVRGVVANDNEKFTVMLNGHSINNVVEPEFLDGPLNLGIAKSVEVLVGPGSVLYGADTMAGTINVLTKEINGGEGSITYGSRGRATLQAIAGSDFKDGGNITMSLTAMQRNGYNAYADIPADRQSTNANGYDYGQLGHLNPSTLFNARATKGGLTVQFISYNVDMIEYDEAARGDGHRLDTINAYDARYERDLTEVLTVFGQISYDNDRMQRKNFAGHDPSANAEYEGKDLTQTKYGGEAGLRLHNPWNVFQVGVQRTVKEHYANYRFRAGPEDPTWAGSSIKYYNDPTRTHVTGFYLSEDFTPTERLRFTVAARGDRDTILGNSNRVWVSPRAAIAWQATDLWTTKVMYNTATRMPTPWASPLNELDSNPTSRPPSWVNQPADRPERLTAYEFQNILANDVFWFSVNGYYQKIDDFMTWGRPFTNVGNYHGTGAETSLKVLATEGWYGWFNASYSSPRFDMTKDQASLPLAFRGNMNQDELPWTPRFVLNLGVQAEVGWNTTISPTLRSFFREVVYNTAAPYSTTDPDKEVYHRAYLDITSHTERVGGISGLQFDATIRNATNNTKPVPAVYQNVSLYTVEPVVLSGTVTYDF